MATGTQPTTGTAAKRSLPCSVRETRRAPEPGPREPQGDPLDPLVRRLYDTVLGEESWRSFLESLARALRADAIALVAASADGAVMREIGFDPGGDASARRGYLDCYAALDPWARTGAVEVAVGRVAVGTDFFDEAGRVRTGGVDDDDWHGDLRDGRHHRFGARLFEDSEDIAAAITGHRRKRAGAFGEREIGLLSRLVPHLRRALRMRHELESVEAEREASAWLLERVSVGTILVDEQGRVVRSNRVADEILARRDGLVARTAGLEASTRRQTAALRKAIADAAATSRGGNRGAGERFRIARPSGGRPYLVEVSPVGRRAQIGGATRGLAAILLTDGNGGGEPDQQALQSFYELTPAEAELTALLARGLCLDEAADHRRVSRNTARGQLKRIFAKTGARRQAELVRMVLQGPAGFTRR